jgi:short subunit dehydrogenase-like uncharacterized protein
LSHLYPRWFELEPRRKFATSPRLAFTLYVIMAKSLSVKRKTAGRPATGTEPLYGVRINDPLMKQIMDWGEVQGATRSEAIRRLVELGLTVKTKARSTGRRPTAAIVSDLAAETIDSLPPKPIAKPGRSRAQELARDAIEKMVDPTASLEERDQRQRRLTKGPTEFRGARVDQPRTKRK